MVSAVVPRQMLAQAVGGTITGVVKDPGGSALAGVAAVMTNTKTGVITTVKTNGAGIYRGTNLQPGVYDLMVSLPGFSNGANRDVQLSVGAEVTIDFALTVASVNQEVTVTGSEASVDLATSSLAYDVPGTAVRELPLNGRDFTALATLLPGVSQVNAAPAGSARTGFGRALTISGQRPATNNYLEDGISLNDQSNNTPGSVLGVTLGVDAIDQFTILTDTFPVEYGNAAGGVLNAVTKSGTNTFHGNAFYFGRNSAIDALNKFDVTTLPDPEYRRHQYGASFGGPIHKDKAFFFGNFEAINQLQGVTQTDTVPTPSFWSQADPSVKRVQALYPQLTGNPGICTVNTTTAASGAGCTGIYNVVINTVGNEYYGLGKTDYKFNERNSIAGSYFVDRGRLDVPDSFKNELEESVTHRQGIATEYTRTLSASAVNIARFGFTRSLFTGPKVVTVYNNAINDTTLGYVPGKTIGAISVTGITALTAGPTALDFSFSAFNTFQFYDSFILTKGKHAMKFGGNFERMQYNSSQPNLSGGSYTYGTLAGFQQNGNINAYNPLRPSITFAAQLAPFTYSTAYNGGNGQTYSGSDERGMRLSLVGMYAEDDWRLLSNLTINYGVRYEITTTPNVVHGLTALVENLTDPAPRIGGPIDDKNPTLKNVSPRIGFSYDPFKNGKTAVRAGAGVFDSLMLLNEYDTPLFRSFPFFAQAVLTAPATPSLYGSFPNGGYAIGAASTAALRTAYADPAPPRSYIMQWNLNVEQQIGPWQVTLGYVGARGIHLLQVERNIDTVTPTKTQFGYFYPAVKTSEPLRKINPNYSAINTSATWNTDSIYHALHLSVKRTLAKGLQLQGSYAWSKSIDTASSTGSTTSGSGYPYGIGNPYPLFPAINRGLSDFDLRNNATISAVYSAPDPHLHFAPAEALTKGWELAGIYRVQGGLPFTVLLAADESYLDPANPTVAYRGETETDTTTVGLGERPNYTPGCKVTNPGNIATYINAGCFTYPSRTDTLNHTAGSTPGTYLGNSPRNGFSSPGYQQADLSLLKNNRIGERMDMQLRFEFFNALNHPNLALTSTSTAPYVIYSSTGALNTSTFGKITSTGGNQPRLIQYGIKFTY